MPKEDVGYVKGMYKHTDLLDDIIDKLNKNYNGKFDCDEQRADLFVYVNGQEETINRIDTEMIYFVNEEHNVNLIDAGIHHLSYINYIINS